MSAPADRIAPLRAFVAEATRLADRRLPGAGHVNEVRALLARLIATDGWLPEACAQPHPEHYQQHLLHCDPLERFSVVSFVWGPGQRTPIHDHQVWGLIGMLRGAETGQRYHRDAGGALRLDGPVARLEPGGIEMVSPATGDIHLVANAFDDRVSISIHVYGANIGAVARHVFDPVSGAARPFVSGYSSTPVPNLWDRSSEVRARL
ncbi:cysteine dioxygenase [Ottowia sp.]|jgi:predicted metal-dependent enzyme (double-stranded beta helix superfamily)|uniref:cysteine dioxygenase family protein n=1 Tax=Ottowia sp. TaxID=1898956 RepID=UPI0025CF7BC7|nr:cysteine dioxygenase [Ottowia sp.]MBK6614120.1 cysteine dioxygenase [Ottowia sp.]